VVADDQLRQRLGSRRLRRKGADRNLDRLRPELGSYARSRLSADFANGANLMTITGGHQIDALCHCLREFRELSAFAVHQRDRIVTEDQGEVALTSPDQLAVSGILQNGAVVSFQIRGGMTRGTEFLFEIHGTEGDIVLASTTGGSMQRQELSLHGAQGKGTKLAELPIPAKCRYVPENTPANSPYNRRTASATAHQRARASMPPSSATI
jgi:predicted dehydrogenase